MNNKYNLNLPVYHREYGKMDITRFIQANEGEENLYDCDYWNDDTPINSWSRRGARLFKESELMTLVEWYLINFQKKEKKN